MTWNPDSAKGNNISFSEANTLSNCEWKWDYTYRLGNNGGDASVAMLKGTVTHEVVAHWWDTGEVDGGIAVETLSEIEETCPGSYDELLNWVDWIMPRYAQHYGTLRGELKVVEHELELTAKLPGTNVTVMGHVDGLYREAVTGRLFAVERKTYGRRDRLEYLSVDPQVSLYYWLLQENGYDIYSIMWDGIYTHQWKPEKPTQKELIEAAQLEQGGVGRLSGLPFTTNKQWTEWAREQVAQHPGVERPNADSFDLVWLDRTDAQIEQALLDLKSVVSRRTALRRKGARPIRNIGQGCSWCSARTSCHEALAFPQTILLDTSD